MSNNIIVRLVRRTGQTLASASRNMHLQIGDPIEVLNRINLGPRVGETRNWKAPPGKHSRN